MAASVLLTAPPDVMLPAVARITRLVRETTDTFTLTVEAEGGGAPHTFVPGQFSMLYSYGIGEVPISISGDPEMTGQLVYTIRSVGKVSHGLVSQKMGDSVGVRGPFGTTWPMDAARGGDVLLVAGGIGLAPLRPAIYHILRHRGDYGRVIVLYGARSPKDLLFQKQLAAWSEVPDTQVLFTVDYAGLKWNGYVGVVTKLFQFAILRPERTTAMMCGPEIMMRFVVRELQTRRFSDSKIYLSMERNMKCGAGFCGHCQMGPYFICKDGPVFAYSQIRPWMENLSEL